MNSLVTAIIMFIKVFLMGFQSKNVVYNHYKTAFVTSLVMGVLEVAIITEVVAAGLWAMVPISIGGSLGIVCSMWVHSYIFPREHVKQ